MEKKKIEYIVKGWMIVIVIFSVFLSVGITFSEKGCNVDEGNCDYQKINGIVTNYTYVKETCRRCTARSKGRCVHYEYYSCFDGYALAKYNQNEICWIVAVNDIDKQSEAIDMTESKYRLGKSYNVYKEKGTKYCYSGNTLYLNWVYGIVFITLAAFFCFCGCICTAEYGFSASSHGIKLWNSSKDYVIANLPNSPPDTNPNVNTNNNIQMTTPHSHQPISTDTSITFHFSSNPDNVADLTNENKDNSNNNNNNLNNNNVNNNRNIISPSPLQLTIPSSDSSQSQVYSPSQAQTQSPSPSPYKSPSMLSNITRMVSFKSNKSQKSLKQVFNIRVGKIFNHGLACEISNPEKKYAVYYLKVLKTDKDNNLIEEFVVYKRFSDFEHLSNDLKRSMYHSILYNCGIPDLPPKTLLKNGIDREVIASRVEGLNKWLDETLTIIPNGVENKIFQAFINENLNIRPNGLIDDDWVNVEHKV